MYKLLPALLLVSSLSFASENPVLPKAYQASFMACYVEGSYFGGRLKKKLPNLPEQAYSTAATGYLHGCYAERIKAYCFNVNARYGQDGPTADAQAFKQCILTAEKVFDVYSVQGKHYTQKDLDDLMKEEVPAEDDEPKITT